MSLASQDNIDINNAYKYIDGDDIIDHSLKADGIPAPMLSYSQAAIFAVKHFDSLHHRRIDSSSQADIKEANKYTNAYRIFASNDHFRKENNEFLNKASEAEILETIKYAIYIHKNNLLQNYIMESKDKFINAAPLPFGMFLEGPMLGETFMKEVFKTSRSDGFAFELDKVIPRSFLSEDGEQILKSNKKYTNTEKTSESIKDDILNSLRNEDSISDYKYSESNNKLLEKQKSEILHNSFASIASELQKIGEVTGDKGIQEISMVIGSATTIASGISGVTALSGFAAVAPMGMIAVGAIAIFSVLTAESGGGLGEMMAAIQSSLKIINESLITIRKEMHEEFYKVHEELFEIYNFLYLHHMDNSIRLSRIDQKLSFSIIEISELVKLGIFRDPEQIIHNIDANILPNNPEDLKNDLKDLDYFALTVSKKDSFNGANLIPENLFSEYTQNQINLRSPINNIGFLVNYAKEQFKISDLSDGKNIPNFDSFYKTSLSFIRLITQATDYDSKLALQSNRLINENNGEYISNALKRLSDENNNIINTIDLMIENEVVKKVAQQYQTKLDDFKTYLNEERIKCSNGLTTWKGNQDESIKQTYSKHRDLSGNKIEAQNILIKSLNETEDKCIKNIKTSESYRTYKEETQMSGKLAVLYKNIIGDYTPKDSVNSFYKSYGVFFKSEIDGFIKLSKSLKKYDSIEVEVEVKPKTEDIKLTPTEEDLGTNKDNVEMAYLELKDLFQDILEQSDDINETLERKPLKAEKFNALLNKVNIEETFTISQVPEDLSLDLLVEYQCEVHCVNRYAQRYDEGFRAFMQHDQRMEYVIGIIKDLYDGEMPICHC